MSHSISVCNVAIHQDDQGRYSLNDLHKASGGSRKNRPVHWLSLDQTKDLIAEILKVEIPTFNKKAEILKGEISPFNKKESVIDPIDVKKGRYGGTFVCKELVYSYAMWISPSFSLKVIRAYDSFVNDHFGQNQKERHSTATQLTPLRQTVERLITTGVGNIYPDIWKLVHEKFNIQSIGQLRPEQIEDAIEHLNAIEGEFIAKNSPKYDLSNQYHYPLCTAEPHDRQFANAWMTARTILDERNRAPDLELLDQLEADGYDVTGAKVRVKAMYYLAQQLFDLERQLAFSHGSVSVLREIAKSSNQSRGLNVDFSGKPAFKSRLPNLL